MSQQDSVATKYGAPACCLEARAGLLSQRGANLKNADRKPSCCATTSRKPTIIESGMPSLMVVVVVPLNSFVDRVGSWWWRAICPPIIAANRKGSQSTVGSAKTMQLNSDGATATSFDARFLFDHHQIDVRKERWG
jgi:hypothetical protein